MTGSRQLYPQLSEKSEDADLSGRITINRNKLPYRILAVVKKRKVKQNSGGAGKTEVLVKVRIHFVAECILARKFEFYMGWIDSAVGG